MVSALEPGKKNVHLMLSRKLSSNSRLKKLNRKDEHCSRTPQEPQGSLVKIALSFGKVEQSRQKVICADKGHKPIKFTPQLTLMKEV